MELGQHSILQDWLYRRSLAQARLKESAGELDAALDLLAEAKRFYVRSLIPDTRPIDALKARIYLQQGRLSQASEWVRESGFSVDDDLSYMREFGHTTLARLRIAEYQSQRTEPAMLETLRLLERLLQAAEEQKRTGSVLEIRMVQALAYQAQGNTAGALTALERALTLAKPEGYVRIFVGLGEPMRSLLLDFRASNERQHHGGYEMRGYVDKLLSAFVQPRHNQQSKLVEPLSQRELEILRLIAQGLSNREICQRLFLALDTVKGHNRIIFGKLQAQSRTEAVARARELELL
jgi:LuxR family maltose regulon positive regulatory protein